MNLKERAGALKQLGNVVYEALTNKSSEHGTILNEAILQAEMKNPWFTRENIEKALLSIAGMLENIELQDFEKHGYSFSDENPLTVAIIMAGNIPLVGFQDFAHVLISGHTALCKMSTDDDVLLPVIADVLVRIEPRFADSIIFAEKFIRNFHAVIATGSNNTARYFDYYFSTYPHIIRKNRNSVAVLTGNESADELSLLADDIFSYFGFGCRNVSELYVPDGYEFKHFIEACKKYERFTQHTKYMNNYEYYKAIHLVSSTPFTDGGFFMLLKSDQIASPPGIIHYVPYKHIEEVKQQLDLLHEQLQCVVSQSADIGNAIPFGTSQSPGFFDFADGVDTLKFLSEL
jgi:hypothetical protein